MGINKFDIYDKKHHCYIKTDCTLEAIIEPRHRLSNAEVRKYFGIDEYHKEWERAHRPSKFKRYVLGKCIIPDSDRYELRICYDDC